MKARLWGIGLLSALGLIGCNGGDDNGTPNATIKSVEFTSTPAPATAEEMAKTYSRSVAKISYQDGRVEEKPLAYNVLFSVKDPVAELNGQKHPAGQLYNYKMEPLLDPLGNPVVAETPDANSLLNIDGKLFLVTHYEYDWILSDGSVAFTAPGWYTRMPMSMTLSDIAQAGDGKLTATKVRPIDFSGVNGIWIPCFGSQTPWNTHLGSEEDYDLIYNPLDSKNYGTTAAGLKAMRELYFKGEREANPYHYGLIPEVTVKADGSTSVVKHYAMSRGTWEVAKLMPDGRTAYLGDDGAHVQMTMFVADKYGDLSAGTVYTAKWNQTSDQNGGSADLTWIKLGHGTDAEIKALAEKLTFNDIFSPVAPNNGQCPAGYQRVRAGSTADECLTLKPGMEKAAAFLETRRYTALLGGTTEWTKMEGIAVNGKDKKLYMAMSRIETSMRSDPTEPADHIKLPENKAGATYTLDLKSGGKDSQGNAIDSEWVAVRMYVEPKLLGKPMATDALGNTAEVDSIANTDNVFFSEKMRTLFIGEDSGMHVNNFIWAYNVDTQQLSRILTVTAGAETNGLQVVENLNGHAYIMANSQHWGDFISTTNADLKARLNPLIDKFYAPVGYIGGIPGL
ncbi:MAG: alkaline phosphatase PhoX [Candidatus Contendobacter sp.]